MISDVFDGEPGIEVDQYEGLTVDYCKSKGATYLLRGLRTSADFEFERAIAQLNKSMYPQVESVFLLTLPEHTPINSTIVRDIIRHGGDANNFLPKKIDLKKYL
jgi:pantetheine-phosphate adenylyltransferase